MNFVEDLRGLSHDRAEALDGSFVLFQSGEEHPPVVVVRHYLNRLGTLLDLCHWLLDNLKRVLIAFGLEAEFGKIGVETGDLLTR